MADGADGDQLGDLLSQMGLLQQQLSDAEATVGTEVVEGTAGGGAVVVRASGELTFESVRIYPSVVEAGDVQVLEDLVLAAVRDASSRLQDLRRTAMGAAVSSALGGLFGTIGDDDQIEDDQIEGEDVSGEDEGPARSDEPS